MKSKGDEARPVPEAGQDESFFFSADPPPQASGDRHYLAANPQLDRPGENRLGGTDGGAGLFVSGVSAVVEGAENAMRVMVMSGNAMAETDVDRRLAAFREALEFMDSVQEDPVAAEAIENNRGLVLGSIAATLMARRDGDREQNRGEAIDFYKRALQHFVDHGDRENVAKTKYNLADAYGSGVSSDERSELRLALSYLREVISETSPSTGGALGLMARLNFGSYASRIFEEIDDAVLLEEAIVNVEEVLSMAEKSQVRELRSSALNTLGALYSMREFGDRKQNLQRAIALLEESLKDRPREERPDAWSMTGSNLLSVKRVLAREFPSEEGEGAAADLIVLKEQRIAELERSGRPLLVAGERMAQARELIFGRGADDDTRMRAREVIRVALATFADHGAVADAVDALHLLYAAELKLKNFLDAAFHGWHAIALSEQLEEGGAELERLQALSEQLKGLAARVAMLFLPFGETAAALDALERGRARYLRSTLRSTPSNEGDRIAIATARARVFALEGEARSGSLSSERLEAFVAARAELAQLEKDGGAAEPLSDNNELRRTWHVVERLMKTYSALIVPVFDGSQCAIVVLAMQGQELRAAVAIGERDLGPVFELWNSADWDDPASRKATVDALANELWEVFGISAVQGLMRREIPFGSRVAIVPPGEFGQLPLTLSRDAESGAVLGEMFEFSFSPSIAALDRPVSEPEVPTLAAIMDPTEDLPFAPAEAINSREVFDGSGNSSRFLIGSDCTKDAVLATLKSRSHWLFSAHGMFDPSDMHGSGIQLAGDESLSLDALFQIADLEPPRLVVLSSCDTGRHMVGSAADEFVGLPLGFLKLGAGGVLASLWPVSDAATMLFVSAFMTSHILNGNRPAYALQDGQHWLRNATAGQIQKIATDFIDGDIPSATRSALHELNRQLSTVAPSDKVFGHPYYWGGFVLYGA